MYVCAFVSYVHLCNVCIYIYGKKKKENKHTTFLILIFHRFKIYIKNYFFSFKYKIFTSQFENKKKLLTKLAMYVDINSKGKGGGH